MGMSLPAQPTPVGYDHLPGPEQLDAEDRAKMLYYLSELQGQPDSLSDLLDDVTTMLVLYVVFPSDAAATAVALWVAHTYLVDRLRTTPYLHVSSPEPESGKSWLLDVLELLVHNPWVTITPSPAVLYRKINSESENGGLTLLLDEVDPIFKRGSDDSSEALRAVLNAGYQKGRTVPRCVPPRHHIEEFDVFGAKALAGIGDVPDTIASRSIRIAMKRRKPSEPVEPLFPDELTHEVEDLTDRLTHVRDVPLSGLRGIRRELLSLGLGDRAADGWSSLVAIAEEAGGAWPGKALKAAEALSRKQTYESDNLGLRVLTDSQMVLKGWPHDHVFSKDLRDMLIGLEDAPWEDHFGKPISQRKIATLLAGYEVGSATRRIDGETRKGYSIIDLKDAWQRYLPPETVTNVTSQFVEGETPSSRRSQTGVVTDPESPVSPVTDWDVTDVTDQMPVTGTKPGEQPLSAKPLRIGLLPPRSRRKDVVRSATGPQTHARVTWTLASNAIASFGAAPIRDNFSLIRDIQCMSIARRSRGSQISLQWTSPTKSKRRETATYGTG